MLDWGSASVLSLFSRFGGTVLNTSSRNPFDRAIYWLTGWDPMWMHKVEAETPQWGPADEPALVCSEAAFAQAFHYWRGASGRRYEDGSRVALTFGQTKDDAATVNLAHLRHEGAKCGANEVHIHLLAENADARVLVEADLVAAHTRRLAAA